MDNHNKIINQFLEKYLNDNEIQEDDIEEFVEEGVSPLLDQHEALVETSVLLVEEILRIFPQKELAKMKNTKFYKLLSRTLQLTTKHELQ